MLNVDVVVAAVVAVTGRAQTIGNNFRGCIEIQTAQIVSNIFKYARKAHFEFKPRPPIMVALHYHTHAHTHTYM